MKSPNGNVVSPWRFYLVVGVLVCMLALLVGRVLSLQVLDTDRGRAFLKDQGAIRSVRSAEIPAYRGVITDRRGEPLAVSTPVISLVANPQLLLESDRLGDLATALGIESAQLHARLQRYRDKQFMYLARHREPVEARNILALQIEGVYGEREYRRFYPAGEVAAQLVGITNLDGRGIAGLELAYDKLLRGIPGNKRYIKDRRGKVVRDLGVMQPARPGRDLRLSIDMRLQYLLHRELQRAIATSGAASGSIVTLDSRSGEVLAMVSHPVYNPNNRRELEPQGLRNRALTDVFEPGSIVKSLTLVAALESGRYRPDTVIDTSPGHIQVGGKVYPDPRNYGEIDLATIIAKSSQVGITRLALDLGHEPIREVFSRFGLGRSLATGFPGESGGLLPARNHWHVSEKVSLAFGYGFTATPVQLASAYSIFANDGVQLPVSLLASDGEPPVGERVISARIAAQMLVMLEGVAEKGTASRARVPGYRVGGKTGTVHKVGPDGYQEDQYIALFAGIAPLDDPRLVTVVLINGPKGEDHGGGAAAAPVFSRVTRDALRILNIAPTGNPASSEEVVSSDTVDARPGGAA